ncbi:MAG: hypothetical protein ACE5H3_05800 [Planctomycetota bacterium]
MTRSGCPAPLGLASRAEFETRPRTLLSRASRLKPAVWRVEGPPGPVLVKDVSGLPPLFRMLGRRLLHRERRILERLGGLDGVPAVLGGWDADAFLTSWVEGEPLDRERFCAAGPRKLTDQLLSLLEKVHARGVYHLDIRQRRNLLLDARGRVRLVDFGAAFGFGPLRRLFFGPVLGWVDRLAVLKHLARYAPGELTPLEARSVLRAQRLRRLWVVSPHRPRGEAEGARSRLAQDAARNREDP